MLDGLRQESIVEIATRQVTVVSEVIVDPEALIMTSVLDGATLLKKTHVALPSAAVQDFQERGASALLATLHAHHLNYLRRLLSSRDDEPAPSAVHPGTLASLVLGPSGEVKNRAGEDQVPGSWLRAAYLVAGMTDVLAESLKFGALRRATVFGSAVSAILVREAGSTRVRFVNQDAVSERLLDDLAGRVRETA